VRSEAASSSAMATHVSAALGLVRTTDMPVTGETSGRARRNCISSGGPQRPDALVEQAGASNELHCGHGNGGKASSTASTPKPTAAPAPTTLLVAQRLSD
jgi:hypothetical protein